MGYFKRKKEKIKLVNDFIWIGKFGNAKISKDKYGSQIHRDKQGTKLKEGWVIHHLRPLPCCGKDKESNVIILQWENRKKLLNGKLK